MTLFIVGASSALAGNHFLSFAGSGMTLPMVGEQAIDADGRRQELAGLLSAIGAGDQSALSELYSRTSAKLYGICVRLLGDGAEAEDVLQDVYVTIWRRADRFDPHRASPITWLAVIARNRSIDRLRSRRPAGELLDAATDVADDSPGALDLIESRQDAARLMGCLDGLEERPRSMIRSAFLDGATYPQLADRESVPLGTMKSWIRRGLQQLRKCLEQ